MSKILDQRIRQESGGLSIWLPLPEDVIATIMHRSIRDQILGVYVNNLGSQGSWDFDNGIYVHNKGAMLYCLGADRSNLESIRNFINSHSSIDDIIANKQNLDAKTVNDHKTRFAEGLGKLISLIQPYEFKAHDISELKRRHFNKDAGYLFVRDQGSNMGGIPRVKSLPTGTVIESMPASHPTLISESQLKASQNKEHEGDVAAMHNFLNGLFSVGGNDRLVPNPNPRRDTWPIDHQVVNENGIVSVIENSAKAQLPILSIGESSMIDHASIRSRGHHSESTMNGLHSTAGPCAPSSSFHPHAYWSNSLFTGPSGVLKDPKTAAVIIGIALLFSKGQDHTKYIVNYKHSRSLIDNETVDKDLYA